MPYDHGRIRPLPPIAPITRESAVTSQRIAPRHCCPLGPRVEAADPAAGPATLPRPRYAGRSGDWIVSMNDKMGISRRHRASSRALARKTRLLTHGTIHSHIHTQHYQFPAHNSLEQRFQRGTKLGCGKGARQQRHKDQQHRHRLGVTRTSTGGTRASKDHHRTRVLRMILCSPLRQMFCAWQLRVEG